MVINWSIITASVQGASHVLKHMPNQDAVACVKKPSIVLALSDGHGSSKCPRSKIGAQFAVQAAISVIADFAKNPEDNFTAIKRIADEILPQKIVRHWNALVLDQAKKNPFSHEEIQQIKSNDLRLAYGATLLAVWVSKKFIIYWQLGDGDILTLWGNGRIEQPVPGDDRLFANETTSLCTKSAWRDFRFCFQMLEDHQPKMILCATDGYSNSFKDAKNFEQAGLDFWQIIKDGNSDFIEENLKLWLKETSRRGSGDDISLGLIFRNISQDEKTFPAPFLIACPV